MPLQFIHNNTSSNSSGAHPSSPNSTHNSKKNWFNFFTLLLVIVFISEISFLGRLDLIKNTEFVNSWAESFYQFTKSPFFSASTFLEATHDAVVVGSGGGGGETCEEWLEREDHIVYSRDFHKDPVTVAGGDQRSCDVGCKFLPLHKREQADAAFGLMNTSQTSGVLRRGYDVIMTTSLSSDVPVGYFSWSEYDIMAPPKPKTEKALAAAYISNCGAINNRLQALKMLEKSNVKIDSYGVCHHNRDESVGKMEALKRYKFSLAFENSNEEDYVTEKYFQSLVAGSVPVVYGAPNIQDFSPSPASILHIKELKDVQSVAMTMKRLAENQTAYNELLRSGNLTIVAMESAVLLKFKSLKHETVWRKERPESIRGNEKDLKIHRIYPVGMTQRQALYTFTFKGISFRRYIESHPCDKFEVIFV